MIKAIANIILESELKNQKHKNGTNINFIKKIFL